MKYSNIEKNIKALVSIPAWQQRALSDYADFTDHISGVQQAYSNVPLIFRALRMRCDAISSVPVKLYKGDKELEEKNYPFKVDFPSLLWLVEADLLGAGKSIILQLRNRLTATGLQRLNPFTVQVQYTESDGLRFTQSGAMWSTQEIIYIKEFSFADDLTSGVSTVQTCLNDAALMNYQTRFASRFFENGAMPIVMVSAEGIQDDEKQRIQNFFSKLASGVSNAWRVLATRTKLTPEVVSQDLDKMTMPELYAQATKNIANAFGIPVNLFQGDDNFASADSHRMQFWQDVIRPRGRMIESAFNKQMLENMGLRMELAFDEMDIFQEDENQRATSFSTYVSAGVHPLAAAELLGIEPPDGVPFLAEKKDPVIPEKEDDKEDDEFAEEMAKWERKSLKRVNQGKSADCEFTSDIIPISTSAEIRAGLKLCVNSDEVRKVFGKEYTPESGLVAELKRANDLLEREQGKTVDGRTINITLPEIKATVNNPEPVVNVTVDPTPVSINVEPATIQETKSAPPVVNVNVPAPIVNVTNEVEIPDSKKLTVNRNSRGEITSVEKK